MKKTISGFSFETTRRKFSVDFLENFRIEIFVPNWSFRISVMVERSRWFQTWITARWLFVVELISVDATIGSIRWTSRLEEKRSRKTRWNVFFCLVLFTRWLNFDVRCRSVVGEDSDRLKCKSNRQRKEFRSTANHEVFRELMSIRRNRNWKMTRGKKKRKSSNRTNLHPTQWDLSVFHSWKERRCNFVDWKMFFLFCFSTFARNQSARRWFVRRSFP